MKLYKLIFLIPILYFSCKKDNQPNSNTGTACSPNSGYFNITINDSEFDMVLDSNTQFSILYNYFSPDQNDFIIYCKDQNENQMGIEAGFPGRFHNGPNTFSSDTLDADFFTISVDTFDVYVSEVTFDVSNCFLGELGIMYEPIVATFQGIAHSFPWQNGQPPIDTVIVSGSFCLNRYILP